MKQLMFTVFTPAYNRALLLHRVYESLERQTLRDFEWLVVDDGSNDNTRQVVEGLKNKASFSVRYLYQSNQGKHVAINRGVEKARGLLFVILDSDDVLLPEGLERFKVAYEGLSFSEQEQILGVCGLFTDRQGNIVGDTFPKDRYISDHIAIKYVDAVRGDKISAIRTQVMAEFPFPEDIGRFVPESLVWNRMSDSYRTLYTNLVIAICEYQEEGLTATANKSQIRSPAGTAMVFQELLMSTRRLPVLALLKASVNASRYGWHARMENRKLRWPLARRLIVFLVTPIAALAYLKDRALVSHDG